MQYPTIPAGIIVENLSDLLDGRLENLSDKKVAFGGGEALDESELDAAIANIRVALEQRLRAPGAPDGDDDQFEGAMAVILYEVLRQYPVAILDDPSFWAYLAAGPMWFFVKWREDPTKRKHEGYQDYLDGRVNHACVPLRMFLRVQSAGESLASAIPKGTDFWRSHVIRVRTGSAPALARMVATQQRDARMSVNPLREYAKRINRRWSNQVVYALDDDECKALAESERM